MRAFAGASGCVHGVGATVQGSISWGPSAGRAVVGGGGDGACVVWGGDAVLRDEEGGHLVAAAHVFVIHGQVGGVAWYRTGGEEEGFRVGVQTSGCVEAGVGVDVPHVQEAVAQGEFAADGLLIWGRTAATPQSGRRSHAVEEVHRQGQLGGLEVRPGGHRREQGEVTGQHAAV